MLFNEMDARVVRHESRELLEFLGAVRIKRSLSHWPGSAVLLNTLTQAAQGLEAPELFSVYCDEGGRISVVVNA